MEFTTHTPAPKDELEWVHEELSLLDPDTSPAKVLVSHRRVTQTGPRSPHRLPQAPQRTSSSVITTHPMDSPARWRRVRANKEFWVWSCVGIKSCDGPGKQLRDVSGAAGNCPAHVTAIVGLQIFRVGRVLGQNRVSESRCKPFDLILDRFRHINRRAIGDVAIGVTGVLAIGSSFIELALLAEDKKRALAVFPKPCVALA